MSKHSNIQSQNQQAAYSHNNHPQSILIAQSTRPPQLPHDAPNKEWIATYIDGRYFLTDPQSIVKLQNIEAQIEEQRRKLAQLQQDNLENNHSFLSQPLQIDDRHSNHSFCATEFNEGKQNTKEEKVKNQLEKEEEMYRERIKNMQRAKQDLKKQLKVVQKSQKIEEQPKSQASPSKRTSHKPKIQATPVVEAQQDPKSVKRSIRQDSKSKSYHKSRIQKSIKDNQVINQDLTENYQKQQKSQFQHLADQTNPINNIEKSQKGNKSVVKSSKLDEKMLRIQQNNFLLHQKSIKEQKQASIREVKSIKVESQMSVKKQVSVKLQKSLREQKSVRVQQQASVKKQNSVISPKEEEVSVKQSKSIKVHQQASVKKQNTLKQSKQASVKNEKSKKNDKLAVEQMLAAEAKSQRLSSMKKQQNSVHLSNRNQIQIQEPQHSQKKSIKISQKKSKINEDIDKQSAKESYKEDRKASEKAYSSAMDRIQRVSEKPLSIKTSNKNKELMQLDPSPTIQKSVKSPSVKPSSKYSHHQQQVEHKSQKASQSYKIQIHPDPHQNSHSQISNNSRSPSKKSQKSNKSVQQEKSIHNSIQKQMMDHSDVKSKKSSKLDQKSVISSKNNIEDANESKSIIVSEKRSFAKKSSIHQQHILQVQKQPESPSKIDRSIQWSRLSQNNNQNPPPFEPPSSEKNDSYFINNNDQSLNESSHLKLQILNNQLQPQVQAASPQPNMKKKKEQPLDNQSEKKSKSFVIHSRHGSVKDRSDKNYDKINNSKISSPSKKSRGPESSFRQSDVGDVQSVTKEEIIKLHEQISLLQQKLRKVEQRQDNLQKFEGTFSKVEQPEISQIQQRLQVQTPLQTQLQTPPIRETPIMVEDKIEQLSVAMKIQPRLQIQSSILQVNTMEQMKKKHEKQTQISEKTKLKQQISRLKKIIRDMQIQKIKSIDHEASLDDSAIKPFPSKHFDGKESRQIIRESRNIEKQSIHSHDGPIQRRFFGSNNKRLLEDAGKIMHNTSIVAEKLLQTPRRRSIHKIKGLVNDEDVVMDGLELPNQSNNKKVQNKYYSQARKNELVSRLGDKEKQFHNFIESSRVIAEQSSNSKPQLHQISSPLNNFSRFSIPQQSNGSSKINYSRMVEEMKKNNPEQEQILPQIHIRDIKMPILPQQPHADMSQQQLLSLAKATYLVFGINVDEEDKQLCVKKYKNCVIFTINNQHHQCILWHYSGKFYMGGWKTGQPGEGEKNGDGLQYIPDKYVYKGQFLNGKKNGSGIIKLLNGNIYDGQWTEGVKNGRGVYLDASTKVVYSGEWRQGKKEGQGYLKLSEKEYYYGTFVKSIKEGFGVEVFVNGDKYKGQYKNGKFNGKGKYTWANTSCYEGQFSQGVRYGQGSWKSAKSNGDIYIGSYENDKKNGYGRYVWANGCMYQGGFANDVKHGKGRLTYQDGKEIRGVWEEGNLINTLESQKKGIEHEQQPLRRSVKVTTFGYPHSMKRI